MENAKKNYVARQPGDVGLCTLRAWLTACKIPHRDSENTNVTLEVIAKDGSLFPVVVVPEAADASVSEHGLVVAADTLTQNETLYALGEFWRVTSATGYGEPWPTKRLMEYGKKLSYKDDPDMVMLRYRELCRVPDMTPEQEKAYGPIIKQVTEWFYYRNRNWCQVNGVEIDDIRVYAYFYATIYAGRYEVHNPTVNDNERKSKAFLRQRLVEMYRGWRAKNRSVTVDIQTAQIGLFGNVLVPSQVEYITEDEAKDMKQGEEEYAEKHAEIDRKSHYYARKRAAGNILKKKLDELSEEEVIEKLYAVLKNPRYCYHTRRQAKKELEDRLDASMTEELAQLLAQDHEEVY
jgi:hypothetical protein